VQLIELRFAGGTAFICRHHQVPSSPARHVAGVRGDTPVRWASDSTNSADAPARSNGTP